ncbi:MAG: DUF1566 domain-containing protein, partial [Deltaproteobacteria bacterium]
MKDNLTGLIWTKDANAPGPTACATGTMKTWQGALDHVKCLNTEKYLGHTDWRLPNRKELHSLSDYSRYNNALPSGHPFTNVQPNYYWSSTTSYAYGTGRALAGNMWNGYVADAGKGYSSVYVWPVRTGQSESFQNLVISKYGNGSGTVTSNPVGINCGSDCSDNYSSGTSVTLTAVAYASSNSTFTGWSGDCSGNLTTCTVTMNASKNVTANFFKPINLPRTGQTKCYNESGTEIACTGTGQDGEIQAGLAWPDPRFTPGTGDESECMIDNMTGLMWPKNGNLAGSTKIWNDAID